MAKDYIPREKLLGATNGSIYKLAVLAAKRAMGLAEGEKPLVEKKTEKLLDLALEEIEDKKIEEFKGKNPPAGRKTKIEKNEKKSKEEKKKTEKESSSKK